MVEKLPSSDPSHTQLYVLETLSRCSPPAMSCCPSGARVPPGSWCSQGVTFGQHIAFQLFKLQKQEAVPFNPDVETASLPQWL